MQNNVLVICFAHRSLIASPPTDAPYLILKGADTGKKTKSFCSGGDVVAIYKEGLARYQSSSPPSPSLPGPDGTDIFFRHEYHLNSKIARYAKQLSILDGITMGGGCGLSLHSDFPVSTSRTVLAMPETSIGLFPDVGGSSFLPKLGGWGTYLGITGGRIDGPTCRRLGVTKCHVPDWEACEPEVVSRLESGEDAAEVLASFDVNEARRTDVDDLVDECFTSYSFNEIVESLSLSSHPLASKTLEGLKMKSPASVCITLEQLKRGNSMDCAVDSCLKMEFDICQNIMQIQGSDFYEGVRAVLVDKDNKPKWRDRWGEVEVGGYFREAEAPWTREG